MENRLIHSSAVIEPGAKIANDVIIGPFSYIGSEVILHSGVQIKSHVVVKGKTEIGQGSVVYSFAVIGEIPQDLKFKGEKTSLKIGKRNQIRENVTINVGTEGGGGLTSVGNNCLFMTGSHVAHDAKIGDNVIIANCGAVAGHCVIEDDVIIGGLSGIHQFVRIGRGVAQRLLPGLADGSNGLRYNDSELAEHCCTRTHPMSREWRKSASGPSSPPWRTLLGPLAGPSGYCGT